MMDIMRAIELGEFAGKMALIMDYKDIPTKLTEDWHEDYKEAFEKAFTDEMKDK